MLRYYQVDLKRDIYHEWQNGARVVMATAPTGAGKTTIFCDILKELGDASCVVAHRNELVSQAALALNREGLPHGIIAPNSSIHEIVAAEMSTHGRSLYSPSADVRVAGVDTLVRRDPSADAWYGRVKTLVIDEGHHVVQNKWAKAFGLFPNARGLLVTAHALRADGKGLGRNSDGIVDSLVVGPSARQLIDEGYLCDYRLAAPRSDINYDTIKVGDSGEFNQVELRAAVHESKQIVGDVVANYLRFARGKLGITFAVDVESATELARAYTAAGVPAEVITAETPIATRAAMMRQFRERRILQLCNCEILTEGVDVPAVEVISLARATASFQLYSQMFGRGLRIMVSDELGQRWGSFTDAERLQHIAASQKPYAIIIDHVGNWQRHGLPDTPRLYSLDRREKKRLSGTSYHKTCEQCTLVYEAYLLKCPYCGFIPEPRLRSTPVQVEGDLALLEISALNELRKQIAKIDSPMELDTTTTGKGRAIFRAHNDRFLNQQQLRETMKLWGGWREFEGDNMREAQKRFYFKFGVDVMTAQALGSPDAVKLDAAIKADLAAHNVVGAS